MARLSWQLQVYYSGGFATTGEARKRTRSWSATAMDLEVPEPQRSRSLVVVLPAAARSRAPSRATTRRRKQTLLLTSKRGQYTLSQHKSRLLLIMRHCFSPAGVRVEGIHSHGITSSLRCPHFHKPISTRNRKISPIFSSYDVY